MFFSQVNLWSKSAFVETADGLVFICYSSQQWKFKSVLNMNKGYNLLKAIKDGI